MVKASALSEAMTADRLSAIPKSQSMHLRRQPSSEQGIAFDCPSANQIRLRACQRQTLWNPSRG